MKSSLTSRRKVSGVMVSPREIRLEEPLDLPEGTLVEVVIDTHPSGVISQSSELPRGSLSLMLAVLDEIREELQRVGFVPPAREEVDERIRLERLSWEDKETR